MHKPRLSFKMQKAKKTSSKAMDSVTVNGITPAKKENKKCLNIKPEQIAW